MFTKRAGQVDGELRILADPPLIVPFEDIVGPDTELGTAQTVIKKLLWSYRRTLGHEHPRGIPLRPRRGQEWALAASEPAATWCSWLVATRTTLCSCR